MAGKIFVNYRRGDDAGFTQLLYAKLEDEFDTSDLFMDVEGHIKPGDDFVQVLDTQVAQCDVLLAVIGPRWMELLKAREGDPNDFAAIEIKSALERNKRVIPVLVGGALMPRADALPNDIRMLSQRNAVGLRPDRFKTDCLGLISALRDQLAAAEIERNARSESERKAAEEARFKTEAESAARAAEVERVARENLLAGISPEQIRKAEELNNWEFVKQRKDTADLRDHIARFAGGSTERYARDALEGIVWTSLGGSPTESQLKDFLDEFPKGVNSVAARERFAAIEAAASEARVAAETEAAAAKAAEQEMQRDIVEWATASSTDTVAAYRSYLQNWPMGQHAQAARARERALSLGPTKSRLKRSVGIGTGVGFAIALVGWLLHPYSEAWILVPRITGPRNMA